MFLSFKTHAYFLGLSIGFLNYETARLGTCWGLDRKTFDLFSVVYWFFATELEIAENAIEVTTSDLCGTS